MNFGKNFLPKIPARWTLNNATMTESTMDISANGSATVEIKKEDAANVPEAMLLTIVAESYMDSYEPLSTIEIAIRTIDNDYIYFYCPITDTGNGIYTTILQAAQIEYTSFIVTISSVEGIRITDWTLSGPVEGDTTAIVNEIKGEIPALLFDYNTAKFDIGQMETTIALISANLLKNTDLNGHIQVTYTASEDATLIIRVKDNEISELFTPILYDVKAGRGSIGIPHAYLEKFTGIHTFTVTAQVTSGSLFFDVRSILYTIDGGHLAQRIMDVGMDVRDIALRRTKNEGEPSWIYAIGIDDGKAMVRARPYNEVVNIAWEPQAILGEAVECAIEFDGDWSIHQTQYRFETDILPWYFWIDPDKKLYGQHGSDTSTKRELATGVNKLAAIKGYRNTAFLENDQGLIAVYVKSDGNVYYRNRCMALDGQFFWEIERLIEEFTGTAVDINAFRTNDYRIGFVIEDYTGASTMMLTGRNWAGIGIRPDHFRIEPSAKIDFKRVKYYDGYHTERFNITPSVDLRYLYGADFNEFIDIENIDDGNDNYGLIVRFSTRHKIINFVATDFELYDSNNVRFRGLLGTKIDSNNFEVTFEDFNNAIGDITLKCLGLSSTNEAGYLFTEFVGLFTPVNLEPIAIDPPVPEVIWNE